MNRLEHLLIILSEECDETGQRASKALRFGISEIQPNQQLTNAERIVYEFNHILAMMEMLQAEGYINSIIDRDAIEQKKINVKSHFNLSIKQGTLIEN